MISYPRDSTSSQERVLTVAWVPTGMNTGVCTVPWARRRTPRRAAVAPSLARSSKEIWPTEEVMKEQNSKTPTARPAEDDGSGVGADVVQPLDILVEAVRGVVDEVAGQHDQQAHELLV